MSKHKNIVKYKGSVYVATDINVVSTPSGGAEVISREYNDDIRGVYRRGEKYYGFIKLKWHTFGELDDFSFELNDDSAWVYATYIAKDGDPRKVTLNRQEVEVLQFKAVAPSKESETSAPFEKFIDVEASVHEDISGHYVRVGAMPIYYREFVGDVTSIYGRFCINDFSVLDFPYDVPPEVVYTYVDTLKKALAKKYPDAAIDVEATTRDKDDSMGCFGYVFPKASNNREVLQARHEIDHNIVMRVWQEVYRAYVQKRLPQAVPVQTQASTKITTADFIQQILDRLSVEK